MNSEVINNIVELHGTPIYVYDAEKVESQYNCLKNSLPENFEIFYSMKANPLLGICQMMKILGSNIEIASEGELNTALEAGFSPNDIIFTSPGKTYEELGFAIETGIYSINIESLEEAELINNIAEIKSKKVNISIRINPNFDISGAGIKMSGVATQFGIDYLDFSSAYSQLKKLSNINVIGIHVYNGTQVLKAESIYNGMEEIIKMALHLSNEYGFKLKFLDLGGGFGVPYFKGDYELDINELKDGICAIWNKYKDSFSDVRMAVESGRFIIAEAGVYITKVLYTKENKGQIYEVCDGGSNFHANSAFLGRHIRNNFPMYILDNEHEVEATNYVGPLCTPTDVLGQKVMLPKAAKGDILVVEKSGAYGLTNSPMLFLSHPHCAEVIYYNNEILVLRERGRKEDFIKGQNRLV